MACSDGSRLRRRSSLGRDDYTGTRRAFGGHRIDFGTKNKARTPGLHSGQCGSQWPYTSEWPKNDLPELQHLIAAVPMPSWQQIAASAPVSLLPLEPTTLSKAAGRACEGPMQAFHSMLVGPSTQSKTVTAASANVGSIGISREPGTMFDISDRIDRPPVARPHNSGRHCPRRAVRVRGCSRLSLPKVYCEGFRKGSNCSKAAWRNKLRILGRNA